MTHIPEKALGQHIAILGKTGSGKTYTAKGAAENLLDAGARLCVVDPTGAWWGLKSSRDGKKAAYPIVIFGGEHSDFPISKEHGAAIAELVGTSDMSSIIDTQQMTVGERTRFFTDFAETLLRKNKNPLHLVIDEAHNFMPQGKVPDPQAGRMLHAGNNLVSMGRSRGLRIILISQRPAKLHKDSLTQVETLVALRLIAPQDVGAVKDWIGEWADPKEGKEILQSLPSLKTGTGWIWSPENGILKKAEFPMIRTYDSSRAPEGEAAKVVLAQIDMATISARLETAAAEIFNDDPKRLRARIAELERAGKVAPKPATVDPDIAERAKAAGYQEGFAAAMREAKKLVNAALDGHERIVYCGDPVKVTVALPKSLEMAKTVVRARNDAPTAPAGDVTGPQQRILDALATLETLGVKNIKKNHAAAFSGASPTSSSFANNLGALRTKGYIEYPRSGEVALTTAGLKVAAYPITPVSNDDLHQAWIDIVPAPQGKILKALIQRYPSAAQKEHIANEVGASPTSSSYVNNLGALRSLGVIEYPARGEVMASETLFPEAA